MLRILMLTDHRGHTSNNSAYGLGQALASLNEVDAVIAASRGDERNEAFFDERNEKQLFGVVVDHNFKYDPTGMLFEKGTSKWKVDDFDVIFLRLPPPVSKAFFERLQVIFPEQHIINRPSGILETSSKAFLLKVPHLCPPMKLIERKEDIIHFASRFPIVLKPLTSYGGRGIVKVTGNEVDDGRTTRPLSAYLETLPESPALLGMKFMKHVDQGDKRTVVVNGEIIGSSLRKPGAGAWLCNVALGGSAERSAPSPEERMIAEELSDHLLPKGIVIFGFDTLVNEMGKRTLSEINTTSVGGFKHIQESGHAQVLKKSATLILDYIKTYIIDNDK